MTRIDDVAALIEKRLALCDEMCVEPNSDRMAEDLLDEGHLLPDLPEPTECVGTGNPSWFDGWVQQDWGEVELHHFGYEIGENDTGLTPQQARDLALALLAAANYAEEHANDRWNLPLHRTEAGYPNCSTCDGGGCPDCTDPA